jgi:hypothetical protein
MYIQTIVVYCKDQNNYVNTVPVDIRIYLGLIREWAGIALSF